MPAGGAGGVRDPWRRVPGVPVPGAIGRTARSSGVQTAHRVSSRVPGQAPIQPGAKRTVTGPPGRMDPVDEGPDVLGRVAAAEYPVLPAIRHGEVDAVP